MERFGGFQKLLPMVTSSKYPVLNKPKERTRIFLEDEQCFEVAHSYFFTTFCLLEGSNDKGLWPKSNSDRILWRDWGHRYIDPASDWNEQEPLAKHTMDEMILGAFLPQLEAYLRATETESLERPADDNLSRSAQNFFQNQEMTLTLVFATHIFLDIHYILRDEVGKGFMNLKVISRHIENSLNKASTFQSSYHSKTITSGKFDRTLSLISRWVKEDPIQADHRLMGVPSGEEFKFLKSHPLLSGLFAFRLSLGFQEVGLSFVNETNAITDIVHLCNALDQEGLFSGHWKDMGLLCHLQGQEAILGGVAKDREGYDRKHSLAWGYSVTEFARNKRNKPNSKDGKSYLSGRGRKILAVLAPVSQIFKNRYDGSGRVDFTKKDLEKIAIKSGWVVDGTSSALLQALCIALDEEALDLAFDYATLHRVCWLVLGKIREKCNDKLRDMHGPLYKPHSTPLTPFVVGFVLGAAADDAFIADKAAKAKADVVKDGVLEQTAEVVNAVACKAFGETVTKLLEDNYGMQFEF
ncbi:uncharacterized protein K452DRAFT_334277 [Aplosporella prunicola CBS 121167]|uniref:Uncharacterized protein n=1 Tax=Aplosporella prunicola CBS 121167 TaxID=1176127 RepID=A0A6A6ATF4_9PEZI|nr:uncharacterized protein K452DRAFT_334277 [Aplosporella prunicola CBS 121167]KAF2135249.1 hypothetical protein K452DRAFT_334277 [Aplosporella prunicola CBS 121167]